MKYDFGNIVQGEKVSHIFTITNTGGAELDIQMFEHHADALL